MPTEPKRRLTARARRIVGITAGVALAASAVMLATTANADVKPTEFVKPTGLPISAGYGKLPDGLDSVKKDKDAVPFTKMPKGARKATTGPSRPGAHGPAFHKKTASTRIVGGVTVNTVDYPSVVAVQTRFWGEDANGVEDWYVSTCTGTVLSPTRVLTAAHCNVFSPRGYTEVIAGRNDISVDGGFVARVSNAWTHQGYNLEAQVYDDAAPAGDLTVLTLKDPLPAAYTPVALPQQGAADPAAGTAAKIVGYGITGEGEEDAGILRAGDVEVSSDATCGSAAQWGSNFDPTRMMCAGSPGVDTCNGDSGGPIFTGAAGSRVQVGVTSWGAVDCGIKSGVYVALNNYAAEVRQQITLQGPINLDWTGDGNSDLFGRLKGSGELWVATGSGLVTGTLPAFSDYYPVPGNWNGFTKLFRVNNWSGDGTESIFARDAQGRLFNYRSDGGGAFVGSPVQIGSGWNAFTDIMVTNNWIGNGMPNLMGRTADGKLVIYNSNGAGGWSNPKGTQIGTGWNGFNTVLTPGDWLGDGHQTLIGRNPAGALRLYQSDGAGGWVNPAGTQIGSGWGSFSTFMSPGDLNGDNLVDLVGVVRSTGELKMYNTNGKGQWLNGNGRVIDQFWDDFNLVF